MSKKIKITIELTEEAVKAIEENAGIDIKTCLEEEINDNTYAFIEQLGLDNW